MTDTRVTPEMIKAARSLWSPGRSSWSDCIMSDAWWTEVFLAMHAARPVSAMTDTLPADLRRHAKLRTLSLPVAETMLRAADEIEQLRAERVAPAVDRDDLASALRKFASHGVLSTGCAAAMRAAADELEKLLSDRPLPAITARPVPKVSGDDPRLEIAVAWLAAPPLKRESADRFLWHLDAVDPLRRPVSGDRIEAALDAGHKAFLAHPGRMKDALTAAINAAIGTGCAKGVESFPGELDHLRFALDRARYHFEWLARAECKRQGIDPDDIIADGGHLAWHLVGHEAAQKAERGETGATGGSSVVWRSFDTARRDGSYFLASDENDEVYHIAWKYENKQFEGDGMYFSDATFVQWAEVPEPPPWATVATPATEKERQADPAPWHLIVEECDDPWTVVAAGGNWVAHCATREAAERIIASVNAHETPGAAGVAEGANSQPTDAPRTPEPVWTTEIRDAFIYALASIQDLQRREGLTVLADQTSAVLHAAFSPWPPKDCIRITHSAESRPTRCELDRACSSAGCAHFGQHADGRDG